MEVYEKINIILKNKNVTKRWFSSRLIELEPKLKSTGEVPTEKAIYGYLNGTSSIKIELIPYIAEVLNVSENDLFSVNDECFSKNHDGFVSDNKVIYGDVSDEIEKLITLLPYASKPLIKKLIKQLEENKRFYDEL